MRYGGKGRADPPASIVRKTKQNLNAESSKNEAHAVWQASVEFRELSQTLATYFAEQRAKAKETERNEKSKRKIDLFTLASLFVYTAITFGLFCLSYCANDISRNGILAVQRAFVSVRLTGVDSVVSATDKTVTWKSVRAVMENSGATPTYELGYNLWCKVADPRVNEPWTLWPKTREVLYARILAPHEITSIKCKFTSAEYADIQSGKVKAFIMADVVYYDRLSKTVPHITEMAFGWGGVNFNIRTGEEISSEFTPVGRHNCADDECADYQERINSPPDKEN